MMLCRNSQQYVDTISEYVHITLHCFLNTNMLLGDVYDIVKSGESRVLIRRISEHLEDNKKLCNKLVLVHAASMKCRYVVKYGIPNHMDEHVTDE